MKISKYCRYLFLTSPLTILTYYVNIAIEVMRIKIIETKLYKKDYRKIIRRKNFDKEEAKLEKILNLLLTEENMHTLMLNNYSIMYHIEQKKNNLKQYYTARLNSKLRLIMKPVGNYPYELKKINEIELIEIDEKHYKEG